MKHTLPLCIAILGLSGTALLPAQPTLPAATMTAVPRLVRVNSVFRPVDGSTTSPVESATLSIYASETGGTPLWQETQNAAVDRDGHYSLLLGLTRSEGLPVEIFASGECRWLGVHFNRAGETEQPRLLLASVPYALKAGDADTLGGRPASSYLLNPSADTPPSANTRDTSGAAGKPAPRFTSIGSTNSIAMFTDPAGDIGNSVLYQNGAKVGLGTTNSLDYFHVAFNDTSGGVTGYAVQNLGAGSSSYSGMLFYDQAGALAQFQGFNNLTHEYRINNIAPNGSINFMLGGNSKFKVRSDGDIDTAGNVRKAGALILINDSTKLSVGVGANALAVNTGNFNTAAGWNALENNTTGIQNTAVGQGAMAFNTSGFFNTALGYGSLLNSIDSSRNTALGTAAMAGTTSSTSNTAVGYTALYTTTGDNNIALGDSAGKSVLSGSNNIEIGNEGIATDDSAIRIGSTQFSFYAAGIFGQSTMNQGFAVLIDANGKMATNNSSRRFKEDIRDMNDASNGLLRLRPVTFRYKKTYEDGSKPMDYGLIAEEVNEVYPDLVGHDDKGQIVNVQYHKLVPMLVNELQKEDRKIRLLEEQNEQLASRLAAIEALLNTKATAAQ